MKAPRWLARLSGGAGPIEMSLLDHLDELRSVLLSCLWALLLLTAGAWFFSGRLLDLLVVRTVGEAQFIRPLEGFSTRMMLSLLLAVVVGLPFYSAQIWGFILPGLLRRERRLVRPIAFWSATLFLIGLAFSTLVLTPTMIRLLMSFGSEHVHAQIAVGHLFDFFFKMGLACGLLFQLPLVVAVLSVVGLVSSRFLLSKWRHAIVLILIVAAVVTPGDGPSQLILAVPIVLLYFISIWIAVGIERGKRRRSAAEEGSPDPADPPAPDAPAPAPLVPAPLVPAPLVPAPLVPAPLAAAPLAAAPQDAGREEAAAARVVESGGAESEGAESGSEAADDRPAAPERDTAGGRGSEPAREAPARSMTPRPEPPADEDWSI